MLSVARAHTAVHTAPKRKNSRVETAGTVEQPEVTVGNNGLPALALAVRCLYVSVLVDAEVHLGTRKTRLIAEENLVHGAGVIHEVNTLRSLSHHEIFADFKLHLRAVLAVSRREKTAGHNGQIAVVFEEAQICLSRHGEF